MKKTLLLAGVASIFALNAQAIEFTPYVGADYNVNFVNKDSFLDGKIPGKYHSGSIVAGTKVTPYAAVEAFGELSKHVWKKSVHSEYGAYGVDAFGILPLGCYGEWEVLGTAGIGRYRFESKIKDFDLHKTFHVWGYRLGAGVQYNITENWGVRAMYRHVAFVNKAIRGFDTLSFGVRYAF
ncbi:MAG: porin family protein [Alphaproteobacteria bacterium]|nr:porin family protein [Alphaproteobacteria bacterium]